jgi:hypothetical protein
MTSTSSFSSVSQRLILEEKDQWPHNYPSYTLALHTEHAFVYCARHCNKILFKSG